MIRQSIARALLITYIACVTLSGEDDMEYKINKAKMGYMLSQDYCTIDEFEEMDYYLYCNNWLWKGVSGSQNKPSIISNETKNIEEAKALYQEFKAQLPLEPDEEDEEGEETNVIYVSPDCKWVVTNKWSEYQTMNTKILFHENEKVTEKVSDLRKETQYIWIVKEGDTYKEMDERYYKKISEFKRDTEYLPVLITNIEGNLIAGFKDQMNLLTVRAVEDGTEQWRFDLQGIQEEVWKIRDDVQEGDRVFVYVRQFEGDEQEGWLVIQAGRSSFFRIAYPSGEVTYLGEYLYSPSFSPDGRYLAYSSVDYDNGVDMDLEEEQQTPPPGIYVREVKTGKTAYIYWDPFRNPEEDIFEYRDFLWIEKESFEEYMGNTGN